MRKAIIIFSFLILNIHPTFSFQRGIQVKAITGDGQSIDLYSNSYALVVGVSNYTNGWPVLPNAANDAREVGRELQKHGFEVYSLDNPTSTQLKNGIETFIATYGLDPDSRLLLYYAGHGHTIKKSYGGNVGYIVPTDAPDPGVYMTGFLRKAISMERFNTYARDINSKHVLYLFDSCFSGSIFALSRAVPEAITYKTSRHVRQFITAGSEDEQVPDRSVFKSQLIAAIRGEADKDQDGYVTGTELGMFLQDRVVNYTRGSQHPQYGKIRDPQLDKGDFVFVVGSTAPSPVVIPDLPDDKPGVDITKYEAERDRLTNAKRQWANWQAKMKLDYDKINNLDVDENLTATSKNKLWCDFLSTYSANNPYSNEDENLRSKARSRKNHWANYRPSVTTPGPVSSNDMVYVEGGSFSMGSTEGDDSEKPIHLVYVDGFYISPTEVTVGEFRRFVNVTGYRTDAEKGGGAYVWIGSSYKKKNDANWKNTYFTQTDNHPVTCVSWNDAVAYCNWKSRSEGLTSCYTGSGSNITCNFSANGYRLPTEAEWEYAARGGDNSRGYTYSGSSNVDEAGWYWDNSGNKTHPVGQNKANEMGLYDMSGNVWELCSDWYSKDYYKNSPGRNPQGPSSGRGRVLRGGSWFDEPQSSRCANRWDGPDYGYDLSRCSNSGFRCVRDK